LARQRLQVVLEVVAGRCRVSEACERLGICLQRFHQIREEALQAAVLALEPKPCGRPSVAAATPGQQALEEQFADLEVQLSAARLREEITLTLPQHAAPSPAQGEAEKKKRRRPQKHRARPGRRAKQST
jgi:hypothetical protein